jgi:hypothetical protein
VGFIEFGASPVYVVAAMHAPGVKNEHIVVTGQLRRGGE